MINIAICEDEQKELDHASKLVKQYMKNHPEYEMNLNLFPQALDLLSYVEEEGELDILLLDVYMPSMLGTELARQLRKLGYKGEIIFTTTSRDHAIDAFEVDAAQYLIKPYTKNTIFEALNKVLGRIKVERRHNITFKTPQGLIRICTRDIVFTETGKNNYQVVHTIKGNEIEVRMTNLELFELLSQTKQFVRCGVSMNLNLKYIRQIKKDVIVLDSGRKLEYPYRAYKNLKEEFLRYQMSSEE